jgi:hypothetical protein
MNRRNFIKKPAAIGILLGLTQGLLPKILLADDAVATAPVIDLAIANNHGHELSLELNQLLILLKQSKDSGPQILSIKGKSRHDHQIQLSFDELLQILLQEIVEIQSTTDAGHAHALSIKLNLISRPL